MNIKIVLLIACVMLLVALLPMPYGYYQVLKLVVCGVSIWGAILSYNRNSVLCILYILCALLYNPVFVVHFDRSIWGIINVITALFFGYATKITRK